MKTSPGLNNSLRRGGWRNYVASIYPFSMPLVIPSAPSCWKVGKTTQWRRNNCFIHSLIKVIWI